MTKLTLRARRVSTETRWLLAGAASALAVVMTGSVAFACSNVMGPVSFSPPSGPPGSVIYSTATGLKPYPARYDMFFDGACMTFSGKLLKVITTNSHGGWTNVKLTIPKNAPMGQHSLCGIEQYPNAGSTATSHAAWTVT